MAYDRRQHGAGARGGNQKMGRTTSKGAYITDGVTADCTQAAHLIAGIDAGALLADKPRKIVSSQESMMNIFTECGI